jgi:hypothetical protein
MARSQDVAAGPRNATVKVSVHGDLVPREEAHVLVFDAGLVLDDGVWEGVRRHKGRAVFLDAHLDRLFDGACAIALDIGPQPRQGDGRGARDAGRKRHDRWRARAPDGDARADNGAEPGPAPHHRLRHHRHRQQAEAAAQGRHHQGHDALHLDQPLLASECAKFAELLRVADMPVP